MSNLADQRRNWLEDVKADAEKLTKRRLEDDGFEPHTEKENAINADEKNFDAGVQDLRTTHGTGATDPTNGKEAVASEQAKVSSPTAAKKK